MFSLCSRHMLQWKSLKTIVSTSRQYWSGVKARQNPPKKRLKKEKKVQKILENNVGSHKVFELQLEKKYHPKSRLSFWKRNLKLSPFRPKPSNRQKLIQTNWTQEQLRLETPNTAAAGRRSQRTMSPEARSRRWATMSRSMAVASSCSLRASAPTVGSLNTLPGGGGGPPTHPPRGYPRVVTFVFLFRTCFY